MGYAKQMEWMKANTVIVSLHINKNRDPELYKLLRDAEEKGESKSALLRDLIKKGMEK